MLFWGEQEGGGVLINESPLDRPESLFRQVNRVENYIARYDVRQVDYSFVLRDRGMAPDLLDMLYALSDAITAMIHHVYATERLSRDHFIAIVVHSDQFDRPVRFDFQRVALVTDEMIMHTFAKILQSTKISRSTRR